MKLILPALPYEFGALEPYIDAQTMEIHHDKHHQKYIDELEKALKKCPHFEPSSVSSLLLNLKLVPTEIRADVRNNAGGHFNHSLFWRIMKKNGGGQPKGFVADEIKKTFGSFAEFQDIFNTSAKSVFGSGWVWLSIDEVGKLIIMALPNQDSPLLYNAIPIMGLDVWEHAYYLQYQNKRPDYINAWWHVIDWDMIEENYRAVIE